METLELFLAAQHVFTERVHAVEEDQWHGDTPDPEWTVADLVGHLIEEHRFAGPLLHGKDVHTAAQIVAGSRSLPVDGGVGGNLAEEWDEAAVESADAFAADGALDRVVALSRGETPVRDYIAEMTLDLVVHGWDLGQAIGYDDALPDDVVADAYAIAQQLGDLSSTDMFDEPVDVPDDAPTIDKLVALTGRDPR
ncbi:TIGR03086 family metal-binding protein [uncultured Jatrophihabitans sp.]|uniref:TIGR03086 family metal-binding protein n=1 Tax=uncultured Jatrophihabitans sp. TaxID=1610747 RepID=UPI0035CA043E